MTFQDLNRVANQLSLDMNRDNRQNINLSQHAYEVLIRDMGSFHVPKHLSSKKDHISSELINRLIEQFAPIAQSTISEAVKNYREEIDRHLQKLDEPLRKQAVDLLTEQYIQKMRAQRDKRLKKKYKSDLYRINNQSMAVLMDLVECGKDEYGNLVGKYLKALLEEYTEHSYLEREEIYFGSELDQIHLAITQEKMLRLVNNQGDRIYMKPVVIQPDLDLNYHYLAGLVAQSSDASEQSWSIKSLRLNRIKECTKLTSSGKTGDAKKQVLQLIEQYGIEFLPAKKSDQQICIKLSKKGWRLYKKYQHIRPNYKTLLEEDGYYILEFECTEYQILAYFFKFGKEATVLYPEKLAKRFEKDYYKAYQQYKK